jgi:hypothetical protein
MNQHRLMTWLGGLTLAGSIVFLVYASSTGDDLALFVAMATLVCGSLLMRGADDFDRGTP